MNVRFLVVLIAATVPVALGPPSCSADTIPSFRLDDLGALTTGGATRAVGINNGGVAVGDSRSSFGTPHAYLRAPGQDGIDLGTLVGPMGSSRAAAISDSGLVVGTSTFSGGFSRAFGATSRDGMYEIGTLGGAWSEAAAVNSGGVVAGTSVTADGRVHAFVSDRPGSLRDLGTLAGGASSRALDINGRGRVVGYSQDFFGIKQAFVTDGSRLVGLGTLPGGGDSVAVAINDQGNVVGHAIDASGSPMAFIRLEQGGGLLALGSLPFQRSSYALGINEYNWVVGRSISSSGRSTAFLWSSAFGMLDLNTLVGLEPGWQLTEATGVNAAGQIVGNGTYRGASRAFVLAPLGGHPATGLVPEPGSLALAGCAAVAAAIALIRRRMAQGLAN